MSNIESSVLASWAHTQISELNQELSTIPNDPYNTARFACECQLDILEDLITEFELEPYCE